MKKLLTGFVLISVFILNASAQQFKTSYTSNTFKGPFTGHVLLYLSKDNKVPSGGMAGAESFPCFAVYVKNIQPGSTVTIDDKAVSYPTSLSDIERGKYYAQIVWDRNLGGRSIAESPGNMYSKPMQVAITKDFKKVFNIAANQVIAEPEFKETEFTKEVKAPSALLSSFHKKPMTVNAVVMLPKEYYTEPNRRFPVLFQVSGYGGDYHRFSGKTTPGASFDTIACIRVFLDGACALGHSVYANSDNNGPWGDALTQEFIPLLEKQFRCNGAKLLTGHSSGGWTVLWLQTHYPKVFDACWSSSPDPVDFRNFQRIDLYANQNMIYGKDSTLNMTGTIAGVFPWFSMKNSYRMEEVLYRGEQMHSFNAVFSKKGADGSPLPICNATTGEVDPAVFENWKNYDISLYLRTNWEQLKPVLDGKVRISVGRQDNFYLNYAVVLLETEMKKLNSTFRFAYYFGDHFTLGGGDYQKDGNDFLKQKYLEWLSLRSKE